MSADKRLPRERAPLHLNSPAYSLTIKTTLLTTVCLTALSLSAAVPRLRAQTASPVTILHSFGAYEDDDDQFNSDGANPSDTLALGNDGNFYGTTPSGGEDGGGTVFRITPAGAFATLHDFEFTIDQTTGDFFTARANGLALAADGSFYGTAAEGGDNRSGTIFHITPQAAFSNVYGFSPTNANNVNPTGTYPDAALLLAADGNFYGTTGSGGPNGGGTVFRYAPTGGLTRLYGFGSSDKAGSPEGVLVQARDGNFYGIAAASTNASGAIFKITPAGVLTIVHQFGVFTDGFTTNADGAQINPLVLGNDGNLYGSAVYGGTSGAGTIFRLTPAGAFTVLHTFHGADGDGPGTLTLGPDGNFYGTTFGTIFEVTPAGALTTLHTFSGEEGGSTAALTRGRDGNFYGVGGGGSNGTGAIFRFTVVPVITSAGGGAGTGGVPFSYQTVASGNPTSYGASGLPAGLTINAQTGLISGTPTAGGTFTVTLTAKNVFGQGSAPLTLTIAATGSPYITSATTLAVAEDTPFSFQLTAGNNPTRFGVLGLPSGVTANAGTGLISGQHHGLGTATLTINAYNAKGQASATLTLTVYGAPIITSATTAAARDGQPFSYQITARNDPTRFGVLDLPDGLTVDPDTGLISGTHKGAGTVELTLNAYNGAGKGSAKLTLKVTEN